MAKQEKNTKLNFKDILNGEILKAEFLKNHLSVIAVILFLIVVYIANVYHVYYIEQQNKRLDKEIKEVRAEYVSTQKVLINKMKYINIQDQIEKRNLGLKELRKPAYTISSDENGK